jgi:hypothetical protein
MRHERDFSVLETKSIFVRHEMKNKETKSLNVIIFFSLFFCEENLAKSHIQIGGDFHFHSLYFSGQKNLFCGLTQNTLCE